VRTDRSIRNRIANDLNAQYSLRRRNRKTSSTTYQNWIGIFAGNEEISGMGIAGRRTDDRVKVFAGEKLRKMCVDRGKCSEDVSRPVLQSGGQPENFGWWYFKRC
jgi:hypothetical protein